MGVTNLNFELGFHGTKQSHKRKRRREKITGGNIRRVLGVILQGVGVEVGHRRGHLTVDRVQISSSRNGKKKIKMCETEIVR